MGQAAQILLLRGWRQLLTLLQGMWDDLFPSAAKTLADKIIGREFLDMLKEKETKWLKVCLNENDVLAYIAAAKADVNGVTDAQPQQPIDSSQGFWAVAKEILQVAARQENGSSDARERLLLTNSKFAVEVPVTPADWGKVLQVAENDAWAFSMGSGYAGLLPEGITKPLYFRDEEEVTVEAGAALLEEYRRVGEAEEARRNPTKQDDEAPAPNQPLSQ